MHMLFAFEGLWWSSFGVDSLLRQTSYLSDETEAGSYCDGTLRETLPSCRKAVQLLDSSSPRIQGEKYVETRC